MILIISIIALLAFAITYLAIENVQLKTKLFYYEQDNEPQEDIGAPEGALIDKILRP